MGSKNKKYGTEAVARKFETWKEIESRKNIDNMRFTVRNDYAFKKLFGRVENRDILAEFLSLVTGMAQKDFEEIRIEDPLLLPRVLDKKAGILDLKLRLADGRKINVEIQNYWTDFFPRRSLYYWADMYAGDLEKGDKYDRLEKCITINLLNENFPFTDKCHSIYKLLEVEEYTELDELLEIHFLDLTKILPSGLKGLTEIRAEDLGLLERWLIFIQTSNKEVRAAMAKGSATLEKANRVMEEFYMDGQERINYKAALKYERDYHSMMAWMREEGEKIGEKRGEKRGLRRGEQQGHAQAMLQAARNMKADGMPISAIIKYTGLTSEQIAEL